MIYEVILYLNILKCKYTHTEHSYFGVDILGWIYSNHIITIQPVRTRNKKTLERVYLGLGENYLYNGCCLAQQVRCVIHVQYMSTPLIQQQNLYRPLYPI